MSAREIRSRGIAFGLVWESELPLGTLCVPSDSGRAATNGPADVTVRRERLLVPLEEGAAGTEDLPGGPAGASAPSEGAGASAAPSGRFAARAGEAWFVWPGFATVRVRAGGAIAVDPDPAVDAHQLAAALLGPVASVLLVQRGLFPLHAGALGIEGRAVAVAAASGVGKSTLVATLAERGHAFLSDDVSALALAGERPSVFASYPSQKLAPPSRRALGRPVEGAPLVNPDEDKRLYALAVELPPGPVPLDRVYLLEEGPLAIVPLARREALTLYLRHAHRAPLLHHAVGTQELLRRASVLAERVPLFRFTRPRDLARLAESAAALEAHVQAVRVA